MDIELTTKETRNGLYKGWDKMTDKFWDKDSKIKEEVAIGYFMNKAIEAKCKLVDAERSGQAPQEIEYYRGQLKVVKTIINELFPDYYPAIRIEEEDGNDIIIVKNSDTCEVLYKFKRVI